MSCACVRRAIARRRAFTLIELLVVIAIVAVLMAILLPALKQARERGRASVCLSNMRTLMTAVLLYTDEHCDTFPTAGLYHGGQSDDEERTWVRQLAEEYGRQADIVRCPSDDSPYWAQPLTGDRFRRTSFASNSYMVYPIGEREPFDHVALIRRPATTVFWVELVEEDVEGLGFPAADHVHPETWWFGDSRRLAGRELELERHQNKANYALLDGHVEPLVFERTYSIVSGSGLPPEFFQNKYDPDIAR
ncbi:MAG: prepilin-type N-terminal cleavage/methylation domain-containing protein [Planctomycetes bacterium]|nr:prepilin-type N-terminal cleavage/methylation domain-containing protein [Planctomycetota bacterium]